MEGLVSDLSSGTMLGSKFARAVKASAKVMSSVAGSRCDVGGGEGVVLAVVVVRGEVGVVVTENSSTEGPVVTTITISGLNTVLV